MIFTRAEIEELLEIIRFQHLVFISKNVGTQTLSIQDRSLLKKHGVDLIQFKGIPLGDQAYLFGVLAEAVGNQNAITFSYNEFKKYIQKGKFIPLTGVERAAVEATKFQAYNDLKSLSGKAEKDLFTRIIQTEVKTGIEGRKTVAQVAVDMAKKTQDWRTDFGRIADTFMHASYEEGRAAHIAKHEGKDALVYKDVYPGACKYCIRHYLTNGLGSEPRIFKLSVLRANGQNNIGRKPNEWKPVLGYMHPWCRCTLQNYNPIYLWNDKTGRFDALKEGGKSKVKVYIINDTEYKNTA